MTNTCPHCGRVLENSERCGSDDCPQYWEVCGVTYPESGPYSASDQQRLGRMGVYPYSSHVRNETTQ